MANDNEIAASKDKFLPRQVLDEDKGKHTYSIEEEFGKTKKNKSPLFYCIAGGFLLLLLVLTYTLTSFIHKSYASGVGAGLIKDIQLKSLFVESQGIYDKLRLSVQDIDNLKKEREQESLRLRQEYERDIENLKKRKLPSKKYQAEHRKKSGDFRKKLQTLRKKYNKTILEKKETARKLKKKAEKNERFLKQKALEIKQIASNYGQLEKIKLDQQLLKFNPIIKEKALRKILMEKNEFSSKSSIPLSPYPEELAAASLSKIQGKAPFEKRLEDIKKQNALLERLLKIPYVNSIPAVLKRVSSISKNITQSYEKLWQSSYKELQRKETNIRALEHAFEHYGKSLSEDSKRSLAYVLDGRDPENIYLYVKKGVEIDTSSEALIWREEDERVARVKFFRVGTEYRAQVLKAFEDEILPFDRLLLAPPEED